MRSFVPDLPAMRFREVVSNLKGDILSYARQNEIETMTWKKWISCALVPSIVAICLYRFSHYLFTRRRYVLARIFHMLNLILFGADIGPSTSIGKGFYLPHPSGVCLIGKFGENVFCGPLVAIGGGTSSNRDIGAGCGLPVIGSDVFLGVKCSVLGPVNVGDGSIVGAHALVLNDVAPNLMVGGVPAVEIRRCESSES